MDKTILEIFILKLGFVHRRNQYSFGNSIKINITNEDKIKGTVTMDMGKGVIEKIELESCLSQLDSLLKFKSKYRIKTYQDLSLIEAEEYMDKTESEMEDMLETEDTFAIISQKIISPTINPNNKLLVHKVDGGIYRVYSVGKKYRFEDGVSDSFTLLNMSNKLTANSVNQACGLKGRPRG